MTPEPDPGEQKAAAAASTAPSMPQELRRRKMAAARLSVVSNSALVLLKFGVGFWTGSISVLSEAVHSLTDLIASGIAFFSVRASDLPPDEEHPYGHGKIESLSGLLEALLIFGAALYIISESVQKLRSPNWHPHTVDAGLAVMGLSCLINGFLSGHLYRVARATDSQALEADAGHLRTDVWTSLGVFAGLLLTRLTGHAWFDPATALLVALLICYTAYQLTRDALRLLMDVRLPPEEEAAIQEVLETDARVLGYHKLRTRKSGSHRHVDVHVQIDDNSSFLQAHDLTEELEDRIRQALPATHVNIHTEPYHAEMRHQQEEHGAPPPPQAASSAGESAETTKETPVGPTATAGRPPASPPSPSASSGERTGTSGR
ncbi:MAG TPA: cation diffusion facilitator family transporter [Chthonomonadaceae bacterium]|nr:cation diffusion facilitator family transporter [Chthonomonadaceae bacterium]